MNPNLKAKYFTLDWDNISIDEAYRRVDYIKKNLKSLRMLKLSLSGTKGFHVRVYCNGLIHVANMRKIFKDDGRRLVNDIFNRSDGIHDILWSRKTVDSITWEEKHLITIYGNNN